MIFEDINNISCVGVHLWRDLFRVVELHEIMRQKDDLSFAQLLNTVQLGHQTDADITLLSSHAIFPNDAEYSQDPLHIFSTNRQTIRHVEIPHANPPPPPVFYGRATQTCCPVYRDTAVNAS